MGNGETILYGAIAGVLASAAGVIFVTCFQGAAKEIRDRVNPNEGSYKQTAPKTTFSNEFNYGAFCSTYGPHLSKIGVTCKKPPAGFKPQP